MKITLVSFLLLLIATSAIHAEAPKITDAPQAIQELAGAIRGKNPTEMRGEIVGRFGPVQRDIGSGVHIEQWDVAGGTLTCHSGGVPTFVDSATHQRFHLIPTSSPAGANLLQSYEMTTTADPKNHGTRYWLGNLHFRADGSYRFVDSQQNRDARGGQKENFFLLHPAGTVTVRYEASVTAETLLESLPESAEIAHLEFTSADGGPHTTFAITISERDRSLAFSAESPLSFDLHGSWKGL